MLVVTNSQLSCAMAMQRDAPSPRSDWFLMLNRPDGGVVQLGALASETTLSLDFCYFSGLILGETATCCTAISLELSIVWAHGVSSAFMKRWRRYEISECGRHGGAAPVGRDWPHWCAA